MHAPFQLSVKPLILNSAAGRLLLGLKHSLAPQPSHEPACSQRYAALHRQAQWATRLFWLASGLLVGGVGALAAAETLLG
ncbi:hypothetical protein [Hymenobacter edaphi]|uniref:Uncharacterized protein n=1 Tax=Hymenobacter edaphi TaxID=2211146 RepID=A0A328BDH0_9BACT|nr:hypothetical protein [Hymenobacter edaphi]RAK63158.1 hypothetical protein DLM85_21450 [Hymenobacter edaphi]